MLVADTNRAFSTHINCRCKVANSPLVFFLTTWGFLVGQNMYDITTVHQWQTSARACTWQCI